MNAARTLRKCEARRFPKILGSEGIKGLEALPGVGKSIAAVITELLHGAYRPSGSPGQPRLKS
jgi:hypothetical protein